MGKKIYENIMKRHVDHGVSLVTTLVTNILV